MVWGNTTASIFWLIVAAMTGLALAFVVLPLLKTRRGLPGTSPLAVNAAVYRSQLDELERECLTGQISEPDFIQSRSELERRLLADIDTEPSGTATQSRATATALVIGILLPMAAVGLYLQFGNLDILQSNRISAAELTASDTDSPAVLRARLAAHLARNPKDGRSWILLARIDAAADRYQDAATAFAQGIAASRHVARDPSVWCEYADALAMAQGGSLAGKPGELVAHALTLDSSHPQALEMAGSAAFERNDHAGAAGYWRQLLAKLPERSAEYRELSLAVARAEALARTESTDRPLRP